VNKALEFRSCSCFGQDMSASYADEFRIPPPPPRALRPFTLRLDRRPRPWVEMPLAALAGFAAAALCVACFGV